MNEMSWDQDANLLLSPVALELSLAALCLGSSKSQPLSKVGDLLRVLLPRKGLFSSVDKTPLKQHYSRVQRDLSFDSVKFGSEMYVSSLFPVKSKFAAESVKFLGVHLDTLQFGDEPKITTTQINRRFEKLTNGKINEVVPPGSLQKNTKLVLVNTLWFSGKWQKGFPPELIETKHFTTGKSNKAVVFLRQVNTFKYLDNTSDSYKMLELPFKEEVGPFSLLLFLPHTTLSLTDLENNFSNMDWLGGLDLEGDTLLTTVDVAIPKFSIQHRWDFNPLLTEVTMNEELIDSLKLSSAAFLGRFLKVTGIFQTVIMSLDEWGVNTDASFSRDVPKDFFSTSGPGDSRTASASFVADRPFMFALVHRKQKTIMLHGHVADP